MAEIHQLDMFEPVPEELAFIKADIKEAVDLIHRVRKGQYAKIGEMMKLFLDIDERLRILEQNICKG